MNGSTPVSPEGWKGVKVGIIDTGMLVETGTVSRSGEEAQEASSEIIKIKKTLFNPACL